MFPVKLTTLVNMSKEALRRYKDGLQAPSIPFQEPIGNKIRLTPLFDQCYISKQLHLQTLILTAETVV